MFFRIHFVRGKYVVADENLAQVFQKPTRIINQALKRRMLQNPEEYYYRLNRDEYVEFHYRYSVTSRWCDPRRHPVTVYTLKGVALLASTFRTSKPNGAWQELIRVLSNEEWLAFKMLADEDNSY